MRFGIRHFRCFGRKRSECSVATAYITSGPLPLEREYFTVGRRQPACSSTVDGIDRLFRIFLIVSFFYCLLNKIYVLRKSGMCHEIFASDDEYAETRLLLALYRRLKRRKRRQRCFRIRPISLSVSSRELNSNLKWALQIASFSFQPFPFAIASL